METRLPGWTIRASLLAALLVSLCLSPGDRAAVPGLPFIEDFADAALRDDVRTTANWSTDEQSLSLPRRSRRFGMFEPGFAGVAISATAAATNSVALGDVDGDGDLDLVTGNNNQANRLYVNSGTSDPWNGVSGVDITSDANGTQSVALGDVDGDGDLDLVAGNSGANRVYLNNGTSDPWNGVSGVNITSDANNTLSVALGDVDGDGDLDLVAGNTGAVNRLYLNNGTSDPWNGVSGVDATADVGNTSSIALGDVDGDGDLDLLAGNFNGTTRFYLNNGTSDPWNGVSAIDVTPDTDSTFSVVLGDVDGDGDLDLVVGNSNDPNRVYLNNGTSDPWNGVSGVDAAVGPEVRSLALGDMDGDGDLDLIVGRTGFSNRVYLNNGTPDPFGGVVGADASDTTATQSIALGDVDGDGDLDIVAGNTNQTNRLYQNNGTSDPWNGVSGTNITSDVGNTSSVALGDVDGDGDLDFIAADYPFQPSRLYLNNGTSDPWNGVNGINITPTAAVTLSVALGDVDGDGDLDLVAGNANSQFNRLFLNNGTSNPWSGVTGINITSDADSTLSVALGDVDGDGDLDLVVGNGSSDPNRVYLNNGTSDPWFGVSGVNITSDLHFTSSVALGDVDGDGDLDVIAGNDGPTNRLYLNNGTSDPWNGVSGVDVTADMDTTQSVVLGDVDGDRDLDLVVGNSNDPNRVYLNNGTLDPWNGVSGIDITSDASTTLSVALGDVDGDGDLDLVAGNGSLAGGSSQANRLYLNNGTSDPWNGVSGINVTSVVRNTWSVALGDVDGDGDLNLVAGNFSQANRLYLNGGSSNLWGVAAGVDVTTDASGTLSLALSDVDADGDLDVVTGNLAQANRLYLNNGGSDPWSGVVGSNISLDSDSTFSIALGDVDGDGDADLVAANSGINRLYLNDGTADPWNSVVGSDITLDSDGTFAGQLGDVDGDGDLDFVAGNYNQTNRLYLNNGTSDPWSGVSGVDITGDVSFTRAAVLGDVDGDGDLDLIDGNDSGSRIRLYLNNGTSNPWSGVIGRDITTDGYSEFAVTLGDVDADGDLDLVAGNFNNEVNRLYLNNGTSDPFNGVAGSNITIDGHATRSVELVDVDRDGDLDLIAGNQNQPNRLYLNNGTSDPWNGVTGIDLTADDGATQGVALGDVDGDGEIELVVGNQNQRNRFYRSGVYDTARGRATSLRVDTEVDPITSATLTPIASVPVNTEVDFWLSNDGGSRWYLTRPGASFAFPTFGTDLRWKAELKSLSPVATPLIDQIQITGQSQSISLGDRVWEDLDGDGIQDPDEPGFAFFTVLLFNEMGSLADVAVTDASGHYQFAPIAWGVDYSLRFVPPPGYTISPQDQGGDDNADSDVDSATGETPMFTLDSIADGTRWDAGMIPPCESPDEPIFIYDMRLTNDGNDYPILDFQDPNQPTQISGYNVYRAADPAMATDPASLLATNVVDMDEATPNSQWVDTSGDVSPSGAWYYQVTAFNSRCAAGSDEGPF